MIQRKQLPTQERLRELFDYHEDGYFVRRVDVNWRLDCRAGAEVRGARLNRYRVAKVDGVPYMLHRLIYQWHHGWCPDELDHNDRDRNNNRVWNLIDSTHEENALNRGPQWNSTTGIKGISRHGRNRDRFQVQPARYGVRYYLGEYGTLEEAVEALRAFDATSEAPAAEPAAPPPHAVSHFIS
jgi:hypothetical protein